MEMRGAGETGIKTVLKQLIARFGYEVKRSDLYDLSVIANLRARDIGPLSDAARLEVEVLPKLGLNNEELNEMPDELYQFCGRGLHYWQYPNQFSKYLVRLSQFKVESYLEIGVRHGGTFVITVEYLSRFHPLKCAIGLDIESFSLLLTYERMNHNVIYMLGDSRSSAFKEFIRRQNEFDLVLIDGDHEEGACQSDFETVREKANICVLHDITSDSAPGPGRVWNRIKSTYANEYEFFEYTQQYESVRNRTGKSYLGIGMAVKKDFLISRRAVNSTTGAGGVGESRVPPGD